MFVGVKLGVGVEEGVRVCVAVFVGRGVKVEVFVIVGRGVRVAVGVFDGVCVGVRETVIVGVGVKDKAAMIRCASAVRAREVVVAFIFGVGDGVRVAV